MLSSYAILYQEGKRYVHMYTGQSLTFRFLTDLLITRFFISIFFKLLQNNLILSFT